jgi:hypothetical protein
MKKLTSYANIQITILFLPQILSEYKVILYRFLTRKVELNEIK